MTTKTVDVLLVGAGAMSTTLGVMLKELDPSLKICMVERLEEVAKESTDCMNNAGTGHAAYCELNYTPEAADGTINCSKAYAINASFEVSLQFWSYLVRKGALPEPSNFINPVPHQSFVWGEKNVNFLRKRYEALSQHHQFDVMEYTEDPEVIREWMPLVMEGRKEGEKIAATRVRYGSDVNFGSLARNMVNYLDQTDDFDLMLNHDVIDFYQNKDDSWAVSMKNRATKESFSVNSKFVFLGAGGGALPLLQKTDIPEGKGYGGFPVSGQWLVCKKQEIVERHASKVYGCAPIGAPPMSVPHLDTRVIDGKKALLFGPFAGFTTKFLKNGSMMDMFGSLKPNNLKPMLYVGATSMDLTKYLISEVMQTHGSRVMSLSNFFPVAQEEDWEISHAGQRVQIIKKDETGKGKLEFGTEVITSSDGTLAALLGASPGASTSVSAMISIVERCFADKLENGGWKEKLVSMIPSYGQNLTEDAQLLKQVRSETLSTLGLDPESAEAPAKAG
ncbi:MAG: malate dehydrogenase (quinone) [Neptuniibacter sp.]